MNAADVEHEFLALEVVHGGATGTSVLCERLMAMKDVFYGGAATALACSMMEHASGRPAVWCSVQMVSSAAVDDRLVVEVDEIRTSRSVSQLRVVGSVEGNEVFFGFGSTGEGEPGTHATNALMPPVAGPDDCPPVDWSFYPSPELTYVAHIEMREASVDGAPLMARWARIRDLPVWSAAKLAFIADTATMGIAQAFQRAGGTARRGNSLDNSVRFGTPSDDEWVLVVTHTDLVHNGFGHGIVHIWAEDGTLLALGSQTFALRSRA